PNSSRSRATRTSSRCTGAWSMARGCGSRARRGTGKRTSFLSDGPSPAARDSSCTSSPRSRPRRRAPVGRRNPRARRSARPRVANAEGRARITVADQGEGLSDEQQARLFDKFERLGRQGDGGSGLGLYISRRLARAMDGDLTVDSAPGQGARFTLDLPADVNG